jgi:hypothetical protein
MWSTVVALHIEADLTGQSADTQTMLEKRRKKWQPSFLPAEARIAVDTRVRTHVQEEDVPTTDAKTGAHKRLPRPGTWHRRDESSEHV